ncbi:hypothetical protein JKP88DRAFT_218883 [Tribonema minus]|uniref:Uncharacterized protein n=1 Tax=Tribonema minus TaxID=303371 RepID=A0A835Z5K1_9STRA|nr:hypothetical protein JKP88DRAFT_218883 [Tribonema minus]
MPARQCACAAAAVTSPSHCRAPVACPRAILHSDVCVRGVHAAVSSGSCGWTMIACSKGLAVYTGGLEQVAAALRDNANCNLPVLHEAAAAGNARHVRHTQRLLCDNKTFVPALFSRLWFCGWVHGSFCVCTALPVCVRQQLICFSTRNL